MLHRPAQDSVRTPTPAAQSNTQQTQQTLPPHLPGGLRENPKDESVQRWATAIQDAISLGVTPAPDELPNGLRIQPNGVVVNAADQGKFLHFQMSTK